MTGPDVFRGLLGIVQLSLFVGGACCFLLLPLLLPLFWPRLTLPTPPPATPPFTALLLFTEEWFWLFMVEDELSLFSAKACWFASWLLFCPGPEFTEYEFTLQVTGGLVLFGIGGGGAGGGCNGGWVWAVSFRASPGWHSTPQLWKNRSMRKIIHHIFKWPSKIWLIIVQVELVK